MTDGHRRHLFASLLAVEDLVRQMERVGCEGTSPTSGQALTPLDQDHWEALAAPLKRLQEGLVEAVQRFAPERLAERGAAEGRSVTFYWLSFLLRQIEEEIVDDLEPARMERKFGALEEGEREALTETMAAWRADLAAARRQIETLRSEKGGRD
jgi:hypothetical protein